MGTTDLYTPKEAAAALGLAWPDNLDHYRARRELIPIEISTGELRYPADQIRQLLARKTD